MRIREATTPIPLEICLMETMPKYFQNNFQYDLEPKIWPLVRILNLKGIPTMASCDGHYKAFRDYICPWVTLHPLSSERLTFLKLLFQEYNSQQNIPWSIDQIINGSLVVAHSLSPSIYAPLLELQETIPSISKYINKNC